MSGIDDYLGAAGDMTSGSQDPDEYARHLEKEAGKTRREQKKEQERILREQQAAQAGLPKANHSPIPESGLDADPDPSFMGLDAIRRNDMLLNRFTR